MRISDWSSDVCSSDLIGEDWDLVPTELTGETHTKVRKVLNPVFAPQKMFALDGAVRGRARELVGAFKDKGRCDFVKEFAIPFPVSIFLDLFGLPQAEVEQFLTWETALLHSPNLQERKIGRALCREKVCQYVKI